MTRQLTTKSPVLTRHAFARTVAVLAATGALLVGLTAAALPANAEGAPLDIDTDDVSVTGSSGQVWGRAFEWLSPAGNVGLGFRATTKRASFHQGCVNTRLIYIYADGTIGMQDSPRVCVSGTSYATEVETMFRSSPSRDLVRYAVQVQASWGPTTTATAESTSTQFIGDAPDSLGTAERLDRDQLGETWTGGASFSGTSDYAITATTKSAITVRNVTNRVVGKFEWASLSGSGAPSADVRVGWTYADGSTSSTSVGRISAGMAPLNVQATSDPWRDVISASVYTVNSNSTSRWPGVSYFGDGGDA